MIHQKQPSDWELLTKETNKRVGYELGDHPIVVGMYWGFIGVLAVMGALFVAGLLTLFEHSHYFPFGEAFYTRVAIFFGIIGASRAWVRNRKWESTFSELRDELLRHKEMAYSITPPHSEAEYQKRERQ